MALSDYNRFTRKYFQDNPGATIKDAAAAWNAQKGQGTTTRASPRRSGGGGGMDSRTGPSFSRGHLRRSSE